MRASTLLDVSPEVFQASFDRTPFTFGHRLAAHPLLTLPRLVELSAVLPASSIEYNAGSLPISMDTAAPGNGLSIDETIRGIESHNSWMVLQNVEQDTAYRALLLECVGEISNVVAPIRSRALQPEAFIFISSASAVTPYHMDPEHGFLLQIVGDKTVTVFDGADRAIVSEHDLERFYSGVRHRHMTLHESAQRSARTFTLTPGNGVHIPVTFPHYVEVGAHYSISLSITFRTADLYRRANAYYVNGFLRHRGLHPRPPGAAAWSDAMKDRAARMLRGARRWKSKTQH